MLEGGTTQAGRLVIPSLDLTIGAPTRSRPI